MYGSLRLEKIKPWLCNKVQPKPHNETLTEGQQCLLYYLTLCNLSMGCKRLIPTLFFNFETVSCSPGWPQTWCVAKDRLQLQILLFSPPRCWGLGMDRHGRGLVSHLGGFRFNPSVSMHSNQGAWGLTAECLKKASDFYETGTPTGKSFLMGIIWRFPIHSTPPLGAARTALR